jgi:hypothetical protein
VERMTENTARTRNSRRSEAIVYMESQWTNPYRGCLSNPAAIEQRKKFLIGIS